jgi:hypothetical protein
MPGRFGATNVISANRVNFEHRSPTGLISAARQVGSTGTFGSR